MQHPRRPGSPARNTVLDPMPSKARPSSPRPSWLFPRNPTHPAASLVLLALALPLLLTTGCGFEKSIVVYTAVDQVFSEPLLARFTEETGIGVKPVFDVEAAKTTGLVNKLLAEKNNPQADVFWSNEFIQTILLQEEGVLAPYVSPSAGDIPDAFREPNGYWTGFGGRARVLIVNTDLVPDDRLPTSLLGLTTAGVSPARIGIALPMFGTTATHAAALYAALGREVGYEWHKGLLDMGVQVVDGNSVVRDMVCSGSLDMGLTDTDDAYEAVKKGHPVKVVFLDQEEGGLGTLINPNTVMLVKGAPHAELGKKFIDWLLQPETEAELLKMGWIDLPCRDVGVTSENLGDVRVRGMSVNLADIYRMLDASKADMTELFVQ